MEAREILRDLFRLDAPGRGGEEGEIDVFGVEEAVAFLGSVIGSEERECDV